MTFAAVRLLLSPPPKHRTHLSAAPAVSPPLSSTDCSTIEGPASYVAIVRLYEDTIDLRNSRLNRVALMLVRQRSSIWSTVSWRGVGTQVDVRVRSQVERSLWAWNRIKEAHAAAQYLPQQAEEQDCNEGAQSNAGSRSSFKRCGAAREASLWLLWQWPLTSASCCAWDPKPQSKYAAIATKSAFLATCARGMQARRCVSGGGPALSRRHGYCTMPRTCALKSSPSWPSEADA